jgi:hypothetical protein
MNIQPWTPELLPPYWLPPESDAHKAILVCPNGHYERIKFHTIDADGNVSPSVVCQGKDCNFHETIVLTNWNRKDGFLFNLRKKNDTRNRQAI